VIVLRTGAAPTAGTCLIRGKSRKAKPGQQRRTFWNFADVTATGREIVLFNFLYPGAPIRGLPTRTLVRTGTSAKLTIWMLG